MRTSEEYFSINERCKDCPILEYCIEKVDELSKLSEQEDNKMHINSYLSFYEGIQGECSDGPETTESRILFIVEFIPFSRLYNDFWDFFVILWELYMRIISYLLGQVPTRLIIILVKLIILPFTHLL